MLNLDSHDTTTLSYDKLGNRISKQQSSQAPLLYNIDAGSNKLLNVGNNKAREYDANGNTTYPKDLDGYTCMYNEANRMASYNNTSSVLAEYQHNAVGQRVLKKVGTDDYLYIYDEQGQLINESKYGFVFGTCVKVLQWD